MKKIIDWTFGGFFRTIGKFVAFVLFGCLIGIVLNKLDIKFYDLFIFNVKASVLPYNSAYLNAKQCVNTCNAQGRNCVMDLDTCVWDSNNSIGNSIQFGGGYEYLDKIEFNIKDSGDYEPGNYNLIFNWGIDPRVLSEWSNKYLIYIYGSRNNGNDILLNSTCTTSLGSGNYDFNTNCNFSSLEKYDHFKIVYVFAGASCTFDSNDNTYYCSDMSLAPQLTHAMSFNTISLFEYDDNPNNAINNQTTIIQNNFDETNQNIENVNDSINDLNDTINDSNIDSSVDSASSFFDNFTTNNHGLTGIITAPLSAIQSLTSSTCSPLVLPLPFVNENLTLPCMRDIYVSNFGGFMAIYDVITYGIVSYWVIVRIFGFVKDFKNPEHDEIEVVDL